MIQHVIIDPRILTRDTDESSRERLLSLPRIIKITEFDHNAVDELCRGISEAQQTGQEVIPIVIDSEGGDVYSLWSMIDILGKATIPIATVVEGQAMSAAAALFCCGADGLRFMGANATLMVHDVSSYKEGKSEDIKADAAETERLNRKLYGFMETKIGKRRGTLWKMVQDRGRADWYLTAPEAKKLNFANHIGIPSFRTTVSVQMVLEY